ncbi:MAG TPA: indole-3-glycerol phosphate synthase TrpC [Stellaceae bacterium]|nr:indole-3-glycerol phosphate synthase TrpC [Stellaceae bacterium]
MSDVLRRICETKRGEIARAKAERSLGEIERAARAAAPPRGFFATLKRAAAAGGYGLIAEIKRASPSAGLIRGDFDPATLARAYERGGAACLSVLTDAPYFQGKPDDLVAARGAVALPVLRKDFMLDPYQIAESRALGADCVLLILAALEDRQADELEAAAMGLGMDVLAEVHQRGELRRALRLKTPLIGINNRDLKSLKVDLATSEELAREISPERLVVSESGLHGPKDLARMASASVRCFLVGESLMRQSDVEGATRTLLAPIPAPTPV